MTFHTLSVLGKCYTITFWDPHLRVDGEIPNNIEVCQINLSPIQKYVVGESKDDNAIFAPNTSLRDMRKTTNKKKEKDKFVDIKGERTMFLPYWLYLLCLWVFLKGYGKCQIC